MQEYYHSGSEEPEEIKKTDQGKRNRRLPLGYDVNLEIDDIISENEEEKNAKNEEPLLLAKPALSFTPVKKFKDMDIDERLAYLAKFKGKLAPFPCEFLTDTGESYRGILVGYDEDEVLIKPFNKEEVSINKHEIKAINIVGFK